MSTEKDQGTKHAVDAAVEESMEHEAKFRLPMYGKLALFIASIIGSLMVWMFASIGMLYAHVTGWVLPFLPLVAVAVFAGYYRVQLWRWNRRHKQNLQPKLLIITLIRAIATTVALCVLTIVVFSSMGAATTFAAFVRGSDIRGYAGFGGLWPWIIFGFSALFMVISYYHLLCGVMQVRNRVFGTYRNFQRWLFTLGVAALTSWVLFGLSSVGLSG